jgi:hypothetical protein
MATMMTNDFMLNLHKTLLDKTYGKDNHKLSESTVSAYLKTLYMLNDKKPFKSLTFLRNRDAIDKHIVDYAESTKKTIYASIASVLSLYKDKPAYKAIHKFYYDKMMEKANVAKEEDTAKKTEKQEEAWIGWGDVEKKREELKEEVSKFAGNKKVSNAEFAHLLNHLVLSLYVDVPPRRNQDYLDMKVYYAKANEKLDYIDKDYNYVLLRKKVPVQFIFNKYKTSKKYGTQKVDIPEHLAGVITAYLKHRPTTADEKKDKEFHLLVNAEGKPLTQANAITRVLNGVFGKNVGSSMLRHIYLSHKMDISDMKNDATAMGHSLTEQMKYLKEASPTEPPSSGA